MQNRFSILTVCTGNICRSPLAEHLLAAQLQDIPEVSVSSAGTQALVDHPMFDVTQEMARSYGVEETDSHRARQVTQELLESSDLILAMARDHRRAVVELSPRVTRRVFTIRELARLAEATAEGDLATVIDQAGNSPVERIRAAIKAVTASRSVLPPLTDSAEDDVVDPYRREIEIHETSVEQLTPAIDSVVSLLRRSVKGVV